MHLRILEPEAETKDAFVKHLIDNCRRTASQVVLTHRADHLDMVGDQVGQA